MNRIIHYLIIVLSVFSIPTSCTLKSPSVCHIHLYFENKTEDVVWLETSFPRGYAALGSISHDVSVFDNRPTATFVKPGKKTVVFHDSYERDKEELIHIDEAKEMLYSMFPEGTFSIYTTVVASGFSYEREKLIKTIALSDAVLSCSEYQDIDGTMILYITIPWESVDDK